jgi:hypothetical protein
MKVFGILSAFALFLCLSVSAPASAQDRNDKQQAQEAPKPPENDRSRDHAKAHPEDHGMQNDAARQDAARQDDRARQDQARQNEKAQQQQQEEQKRAQQDRDRSMRDQNRNQRPVDNRQEENRPDNRRDDNRNRGDMDRDRDHNYRGADRGRHIPDDQFRTHFGREHRFHVQRTEIVNVQQPVVVYGGYSFQLVDPWPAEWSYDDDCYIDYMDDGYYLFDAMHPGIRIAVIVVQ